MATGAAAVVKADSAARPAAAGARSGWVSEVAGQVAEDARRGRPAQPAGDGAAGQGDDVGEVARHGDLAALRGTRGSVLGGRLDSCAGPCRGRRYREGSLRGLGGAAAEARPPRARRRGRCRAAPGHQPAAPARSITEKTLRAGAAREARAAARLTTRPASRIGAAMRPATSMTSAPASMRPAHAAHGEGAGSRASQGAHRQLEAVGAEEGEAGQAVGDAAQRQGLVAGHGVVGAGEAESSGRPMSWPPASAPASTRRTEKPPAAPSRSSTGSTAAARPAPAAARDA